MSIVAHTHTHTHTLFLSLSLSLSLSLTDTGDWALEPQGALTFLGTIGTQVSNCLFERLDGNAVFVGGYNRNVSIAGSEFAFIGNNAVALWGNTE